MRIAGTHRQVCSWRRVGLAEDVMTPTSEFAGLGKSAAEPTARADGEVATRGWRGRGTPAHHPARRTDRAGVVRTCTDRTKDPRRGVELAVVTPAPTVDNSRCPDGAGVFVSRAHLVVEALWCALLPTRPVHGITHRSGVGITRAFPCIGVVLRSPADQLPELVNCARVQPSSGNGLVAPPRGLSLAVVIASPANHPARLTDRAGVVPTCADRPVPSGRGVCLAVPVKAPARNLARCSRPTRMPTSGADRNEGS